MTTVVENTEYDDDFQIFVKESNDKEKDITVYADNSENKAYYIGSEICELLEYKNSAQSIKLNVSDHNKIAFKDYQGKKEPKLDPRQILINKEGVFELLQKNRKKLSDESIDILNNAGIDVSKSTDEESDSEEQDKLTVYSYFNNGFCFEYFVGLQITSLIGYSNIT